MKRSEMIDLIYMALIDCNVNELMEYETAPIILDKLEQRGMIPPACVTKGWTPGTPGIISNGWEPEE